MLLEWICKEAKRWQHSLSFCKLPGILDGQPIHHEEGVKVSAYRRRTSIRTICQSQSCLQITICDVVGIHFANICLRYNTN